ncbi:inorganic phosphate cotransporter [Trichonephila clavipes]|nr:inorganic phosphate cotransporter [Trichonephila clavipes]
MTGESYTFNNIKAEVKYPAIKQNDYPEIAEKYITKDTLKNSEDSAKSNKNADEKEPFLKCRYLVIFMGFLVNFQINCYRLNTSISIVAMVNNSIATSNESIDLSSVSCPSNEGESKHNLTKEVTFDSDSDAEVDNDIPVKTVTLSNALYCLETVKMYLMRQDVTDEAFSAKKVEK